MEINVYKIYTAEMCHNFIKVLVVTSFTITRNSIILGHL